MDARPAGAVPGLDPAQLRAYLVDRLDGPVGELRAEVIAGGRSNLTYRVTDGTSRWVLRRPPLGHVLPTAHDMGREYRVISALGATAVPVPEALLLCTDETVLGAPFYLMAEVPGVVLRTAADYAGVDRAGMARAARLLVDTLVTLHGIEPDTVGLGDFGRPAGYLTRQVERWYRQWGGSATRVLPALDELHDRLAAAVPDTPRYGIVHGDYRLDNLMYDPDLTRVTAVLDWEMATTGDPLADVGLLVVYTDLARHGLGTAAEPPPASLGFPTGAELRTAYADARGIRLHRLDWYVGLGYYKLAIISEGIHARYLAGETVGADFDAIGARVPDLVDLGLTALSGPH
ncbi:phosphotransferase family protein [Actinocatenispora rupis]|uniref:Acyl-CoA dehydrogenase n=1 Tax=Actinocatenispora rupis TaxID=519421 RepID=A0A8J3NB26_9ACTN|nr:phosphotransferase family protein [Actinocatenispora rupis]GID12934.1 acyl-CoA dehydrogenase [Actinocatenispora rupis]